MQPLEAESAHESSDDEDDGGNDGNLASQSLAGIEPNPPTLHRSKLTYGDAIALLISAQIGSGIFSSPSQVNKHTPGPGFALIVWLVSGLLAWMGATCYAELGTTLPFNGGTQEYLKHMYGPGVAFLASWVWILGIKASSMAALSIIATQFWMNFIFDSSIADDGWQCKLLALAIYLVVVFLNLLSIDVTKAINKFMLILKLLTLTLLLLLAFSAVVVGLHAGKEPLSQDWQQKNWFSTTNPTWTGGAWTAMGEYTIAVYAGLWAFSGWDNANMVTKDLHDPSQDLPRAVHASQPIVLTAFIVANICYYTTLSWPNIDDSNTIAVVVGRIVMGKLGALVFAILVSMACLGSVNASIFTTSRLVVSAAQTEWLPGSLQKFSSLPIHRFCIRDMPSCLTSTTRTSPGQTPIRAMLFMTCLVSIYLIIGTFASLITFVALAEYLFFAATTIGLLIMRVREPGLLRPYKTNILTPVVFSAVSAFLVVVGISRAPAQGVLLGGLLVAGIASKAEGTRRLWDRVWGKSQWSDRGEYHTLDQLSSR